MKRCRHNGTWIMAGGRMEWCYQCGAIRMLKKIAPATSVPETQWTRPQQENPWPMKPILSEPDKP